MRRFIWVAATAMLIGCAADSDDDGLSNKDEEAWGSNPELADTDGDGIPDGEEVYEYGTHPAYADSDLDGVDDNVEIEAGFDPLDKDDRPYIGGWPVIANADKNALEATGVSSGISPGALMPRYKLVDQFGDEVDTYDFAMDGKQIIFDISAGWCPPCRDLATYMSGEDVSGYEYMEPVRDSVAAGELYWVTMLFEDAGNAPATERTVSDWDESYPNEHIPVLADPEDLVGTWSNATEIPFMFMVDENMQVVSIGASETLGSL